MWLYQMSQVEWPPNRYRLDIRQGHRWVWPVKKSIPADAKPQPGDIVVLFYAKSGGAAAGFYGWAVILEWTEKTREIYFEPIAPSDFLMMCPWWDNKASDLVDQICGSVKQGTLWHIPEHLQSEVRDGIRHWLSGA